MTREIFLMTTEEGGIYGPEIPVNGTTSLLWVAKSLERIGVRPKIFPSSNLGDSIDKVIKRIISDNTKNTLACFSCGDLSLAPSVWYARELSEHGITTIGGGVAFRDKQLVHDYLKKGFFDGIVRGGCMPLVQLIQENDGQLNSSNLPEGFYARRGKRIVGHGIGKHPQFGEDIPLSISRLKLLKNIHYIRIPSPGVCDNFCGYCSGVDTPYPGTTNVLKALKRNLAGIDKYAIELSSRSPFHKRNIEATLELLECIQHVKPYEWVHSYLDPAFLLDERNYHLTRQAVTRLLVRTFVIGFDAITGYIAQKIGRNLGGIPRTDEQLDSEQQILKQFLVEVSSKLEDGRPLLIKMHYLITPFDNSSSIEKSLDRMYDLGIHTVHPSIHPHLMYAPLVPFSGTPVRKNYAHLIKSDFSRLYDWGWRSNRKLRVAQIKSIKGTNLIPYTCLETDLSPWEIYFLQLAAISYQLGKDGKRYIPNATGIRTKLLKKRYKAYVDRVSQPQIRNLTRFQQAYLAFFEALGMP